jgi:hypothetical protein
VPAAPVIPNPAPSTNAPAAPGTPAPVVATPAGTLESNVVGKSRPNAQIEDFNITDCDQVALINADKIKDFNDYLTREPAFFTINAYFINMFQTKDAAKLIDSINLNHINTIPNILYGTKNCLMFRDDITYRNVTMCLKDQAAVDQIESLFQRLLSCRGGTNMAPKLENFDFTSLMDCKQWNGKIDMRKVTDIFTKALTEQGVIFS